jgi:hypothetical protein
MSRENIVSVTGLFGDFRSKSFVNFWAIMTQDFRDFSRGSVIPKPGQYTEMERAVGI